MKNKKVKVISIVLAIIIFIVAWFAFCGYQWSWGPFVSLHNYKTASLSGNAEEYSLDKAEINSNSPLKNKKMFFSVLR